MVTTSSCDALSQSLHKNLQVRASMAAISAMPLVKASADAACPPVQSWDFPLIPIDCGAAQPD